MFRLTKAMVPFAMWSVVSMLSVHTSWNSIQARDVRAPSLTHAPSAHAYMSGSSFIFLLHYGFIFLFVCLRTNDCVLKECFVACVFVIMDAKLCARDTHRQGEQASAAVKAKSNTYIYILVYHIYIYIYVVECEQVEQPTVGVFLFSGASHPYHLVRVML